MSEMVERVARAIFEARDNDPARTWEACPPETRRYYLADARAAIKAMREPTGAAMNDAAVDGALPVENGQ